MIIVAGWLRVGALDRDRYLAEVGDVARLARAGPGCLEPTQAADPLDAERITVYERWESDEDLLRFRASGDPDARRPDLPDPISAEVRTYRIASVEAP